MQEQKVTEERLVWFDKPPGIMTVLLSRDFLRRPSFFQPNPKHSSNNPVYSRANTSELSKSSQTVARLCQA